MNLHVRIVKVSAVNVCTLLKGLANPQRLMIACPLVGGEQPVRAPARLLGFREMLASSHRDRLRRNGFVPARRDGRTGDDSLQSGEAPALVRTQSTPSCAAA